MHFPSIISLLGLVAASGPLGVLAGLRGPVVTECFNDYTHNHKEFRMPYLVEGPGPTYTVDNAIINFCASHPWFHGWGYETRHCFPFVKRERAHDIVNAHADRAEGNSLQISITNDRQTVTWIPKEECLETIRELVYKCQSGGIHKLGQGFRLFVYPAEAPCPPPIEVKDPDEQLREHWATPW